MRPPRGRVRRWVGRVALALLVVVLLVAGGVVGVIWWSLPSRDLQADIPGLAAPVAITLDGDGIPWIKAQSDTDAAAALGFMHARDRLFEMELMRRAASGRLSEFAGDVTLRLDRTMRVLGLRRRAEAELGGVDPETRALLDAYARGVNAWIARRGRFAAPEFIVLGAPEPWTPVDSLLWGKTMALYLSGDWRGKLTRARLAPTLSPAVRRALWPDWADTPRPDASVTSTRFAAAVPRFPEPFTLPSTASNEWAVDGRHSATGAPLLAGDPHLALSFPSIWYLARVETPGRVLAGATAPGVPFLIIGHNGRIAWTFTTTGADTQDVFVETPVEGGYATPDGPRPFVTHEERIHVRGAADDVFVVRETRHGPVMSDLDPASDQVLAVGMASLQVADTAASGLHALNMAGSVDEAGRAATAISAPVQNLLVADRTGIGQFTTGRVPLRASGDGTVPVAGADAAHDWVGFASGASLPRVLNPASGRIVNANERVAGPDFPVFMGADWFGDWRARRIRALLEAHEKSDVAGFAAMQVDVTSAFAQQIMPALLATVPQDEAGRRAIKRLRRWDLAMSMEQPEPLLFNTWVRRFFADVLAGLEIADAPVGPTDDVVGQALSPGGAALCHGDCGGLLARSLAEATASLPDWERTSWGGVHEVVFAHPLLGRLPVVGPLFTWRLAQPGDDSTIFRGSPRRPGWESVHGPGYRGVYDLADLDRSLFAVTPGQSGHPFSGDAASTMRRWRDGTSIVLGPRPGSVSGQIELRP